MGTLQELLDNWAFLWIVLGMISGEFCAGLWSLSRLDMRREKITTSLIASLILLIN